MATIVIMPGGFHPFHAGHAALYQSAQRAFPDADVYVAATNDTSARPFPFSVKEKLAQLAGVESGHFVQVKSPFRAEEITAKFDPEQDQLIFVRSEKDANKPPQAGGVKKDGSPAYLQPLMGARQLEPFAQHAYMAYLPTVEFGPGMTSATEIRAAWPKLNEKRKTALVMSLYPKTQASPALAANVVKILDSAMLSEVDEDISRRGFLQGTTAAAGMAAAGAVGAKELARPTTIAIVRIGDQTKQFNLGTKFDTSKQAQDFVENFLNQQGIQHYTIEIQRGYTNENQGWAATLETTSSGSVTANTAGAGAGMTAGYQRRENQPVDEGAVLINDPERGIEIRPAGGMGTWNEQSLVSSLARQFADILNMLKGGSYSNIEYALYRGGAMQAKIDALAKLEKFKQRQGRRAIARGREIDLGEDYVEEQWSEKYKRSINCNSPQGFSQRAHCAGRDK